MTSKKMSTEVARMSDATANVVFGGAVGCHPEDTFYEDMSVLRKMADQIIKGLPTLAPIDGMMQASAGWTLITVEPDTGYPDFTMPPIPGLYGVPYAENEV